MRTRAGWIALVLTGGLALAPAGVRAQGGLDISGREAEPVVPLPIYNSRPENGGFYAAIEFSMVRQTRDLGNQVVARRGLIDVDGSIQRDLGGQFVVLVAGGVPVFVPGPPGPKGAFLGSGTPALNVSDLNSKRTYQPGWRETIGYRFSDGTVLEAKWLHVNAATYHAGADVIPPGFAVGPQLADTFLTSPVYNFPNNYAGEAQELALGNPGAAYGIWNAANQQTIEFRQRYDQGDWTVRVPVRTDPISRTFFMVGGRFAWVWESFKWRTVSQDFAGNAGPFDVAIYSNTVSNRMYGAPIGCQHEVYLGTFGRIGAFALSFQADVAPMLDIVKERAQYSLADRSTENKKSVVEYTFSPMLNGEIHLTWYPIAGVQCRLSWSSMAFMNTVHAETPISFNFGNLGRTNDFGPVGGSLPGPGDSNPIWNRRTFHYFDGINVGLAVSF